ncbi:MAG: PP2C family protein-serine/threonine phosphatase [Microcystaceae cyanobacterium]
MTEILIIDDDPTVRRLLERSLTRSGYQVYVATTGQEGLEKVQIHRPSLIICDWLMPGMDGLEVCRHIKANAQFSTTFFILLTSLGSVEDRVKGLDAGADDFLCKPIDMNELEARLRAGLRLHQLSQDLQEQKQLLEAELAEAGEYVQSILPEPLLEERVTIEGRFIPSRQLGGDGFDYFWLDDDHLIFYLLDVSGHGLRSALPSLSVINLLRSQSLSQVNYYQPASVLEELNRVFQIDYRNDKYFTIWYGVYEPKKYQLRYASAGHPPAILLSHDLNQQLTATQLKTHGFPIGMFEDNDYYEETYPLSLPTSLYLFSDGLYEIPRSDGKLLGLENLIQLLKEYQEDPEQNLDTLIYLIQAATTPEPFQDDLSVLKIDFM